MFLSNWNFWEKSFAIIGAVGAIVGIAVSVQQFMQQSPDMTDDMKTFIDKTSKIPVLEETDRFSAQIMPWITGMNQFMVLKDDTNAAGEIDAIVCDGENQIDRKKLFFSAASTGITMDALKLPDHVSLIMNVSTGPKHFTRIETWARSGQMFALAATPEIHANPSSCKG